MNKYLLIFKNWFGYAALVSLLCGIIYVVTQQNFRLTGNDPQYQMVQDAANAINKGADPKTLVGPAPAIEISESLSPFLVIYDAVGNVVAGSATLNGKPLKIPLGVIDYIQKNGKDAASWQPEPGVRQAMVGSATISKKYIVVAGRSLQKIEERIGILGEQVLFGWAMSLLAMLVVVVLQDMMTKKLEEQAKLL